MRTNVRLLVTGTIILVLGTWFLTRAGTSRAAFRADDLRDSVLKVADAFEKDDADAAKQLAQAIAKKDPDVGDVMSAFKLRKSKGEGIGKPGTVKANEDGIEAKIMALSKKALKPDQVEKESEALARASYISAAVAEIAVGLAPKEKKGDKDPKKWKGWAKDMEKAALDLAKEANSKSAKGIKTAATKLNESCTNCHNVFRTDQ